MIITAVAAAAKADVVGRISEGVAGLIGATATDRERQATANSLLASALGGSMDALGQLIRQAYERKPDGKYSPQAVRDLAVKALRSYVQAKGGLPDTFAQYAARLSANVLPPKATAVDQVLNVVREGVREGVSQGTVTTAQGVARDVQPFVLIGIAAAVLFVAYRFGRSSS